MTKICINFRYCKQINEFQLYQSLIQVNHQNNVLNKYNNSLDELMTSLTQNFHNKISQSNIIKNKQPASLVPVGQLQSHLLNLWTNISVDQTYQNLFFIYIETLKKPKQQSKQIQAQIKKTYEKNSLYFLLQENIDLRSQIKSQIQEQIHIQTRNGSYKISHKVQLVLRQLCDKLKNFRRINLLISQTILKIFQDFKITRQSSVGSVGKSYIQFFIKIDIQNQFLKQSFLNQFILFQKGYDPFFLVHYEQTMRSQNSNSLKKYRPVEQLFEMNISYVYRLMRTQQKMLKYMLLIDDHTGTQRERQQLINRQRLLRMANLKRNKNSDQVIGLPLIHRKVLTNTTSRAPTIKHALPRSLFRKTKISSQQDQEQDSECTSCVRKKLYSLRPVQLEDFHNQIQKNSYSYTPKNFERNRSTYLSRSLNQPKNSLYLANLKRFQVSDQASSLDKRVGKGQNQFNLYNNLQKGKLLSDSRQQKKWNTRKVKDLRSYLKPMKTQEFTGTDEDLIQEGYIEDQFENSFIKDKNYRNSENPIYISLKKSQLNNQRIQEQSKGFQPVKKVKQNRMKDKIGQIQDQTQKSQVLNLQKQLKKQFPSGQREVEKQKRKDGPTKQKENRKNKVEKDKKLKKKKSSEKSKQQTQQSKISQKQSDENLQQNQNQQSSVNTDDLESEGSSQYQSQSKEVQNKPINGKSNRQSQQEQKLFRQLSKKQRVNGQKSRITKNFQKVETNNQKGTKNGKKKQDEQKIKRPNKNIILEQHKRVNSRGSEPGKKIKPTKSRDYESANTSQKNFPLSKEKINQVQQDGSYNSLRNKDDITIQSKAPESLQIQLRQPQKTSKLKDIKSDQNQDNTKQDISVYPDVKRSLINQNSKIRMVPGKINFKDLSAYLKSKKIHSIYENNLKQGMKFILSSAQNTQTYLSEFTLDDKLAAFALCSPTSQGNVVVYLWAPIQDICDEKTSLFLFKKYVNYIQQQTTFKSLIYRGQNMAQITSQGFQLEKQKQKSYIRKRVTPITRESFQFQYFFSIQISNISFLQSSKESLFYSDQIAPLTQNNSWCASDLLIAKQSKLPEQLRDQWLIDYKIKSIKEANFILQKDSYDTFEVGQDKQVESYNINMSRAMYNTAPKYGFIASQGFMIVMGKKVISTDPLKRINKMQLMKETSLYFGSGFKSALQMVQVLAKNNNQLKLQDQKFGFKMFCKQLYGKYITKSNQLDKQTASYCNWDLNFAWRDQITGRIIHNIQTLTRHGPQSFICLIQTKGIFVLGVQITKDDFLY